MKNFQKKSKKLQIGFIFLMMYCFYIFTYANFDAKAQSLDILNIAFNATSKEESQMASIPEHIKLILENTEPLKYSRGNRLPLYLWPIMDVDTGDNAETELIIRQLDARGIGVVSTWDPSRYKLSLEKAMRVAKIQKRLGLRVGINANPCTYSFFNGDPRTAHISKDGEPFFDDSFSKGRKMGCPFALDFRKPEMRKRVEDFVKAYKEANLLVDFVFADWEIDGPIEWNGAWESSKRCKRCCENIPQIEDFTEFQSALRIKRSELQKYMLADTVTSYFPDALVGNYAVYPHDGYRYWYDYFEEFVPGAPYKLDGKAKHRKWFDEFPLTGYTFAMPVVYTWDSIWTWYDFDNPDYRWFYNMLLVGSNAGKHTPKDIPIITFVHWHTVHVTDGIDKDEVKQFSKEKYQELLWHLLLRGHDGFFMWSPLQQSVVEAKLVHQVYAESLQYAEFFEKGEPVTFDVPSKPAPVISGIKLGKQVLIRRTDFDDTVSPVITEIDNINIQIPRMEGQCQLIMLKNP